MRGLNIYKKLMNPVIIFTDEPQTQGGWQGLQLKQALALRGQTAQFISLREVGFDFSGGSAAPFKYVSLQTQQIQTLNLPKAAIVRGIAGGTMQQVTQRLNVLHALSHLGVRVINDARMIERTVDKAMTSFLLRQASVATPEAWVCESRAIAEKIIATECKQYGKIVIKPLFGSQGQGVRLIQQDEPVPVPMQAFVDGVYYLQRYIHSGEQPYDTRVFIINHRPIAAMRRYGATWVNNFAQGARCEAAPIDDDIAALAVQASQALDMAYCGVDVIQDAHTGNYTVLEVNSIPAWRGLQAVSQINIAQQLVDYLLAKIA